MPEILAVQNELHSLEAAVSGLSGDFRVFAAEMRPFIVAVSEHTSAINGNGKDGLKTRVSLLEECRDESRRAFRHMWAAIVALGSTIVGWVLSSFVGG